MKYINKGRPPRAYVDWCAEVEGTHQADWRNLRSAEKRQVLASMIREQGGLCAYTMRRIDKYTSHVEHVKPQSRCRADDPGSDLDYGNLVACFPQKKRCSYGAHRKGGWWEGDGARFVSPLDPACEHVFRFRLDGGIEAIDDRVDAVTTIEVLALESKNLTEDRKVAIDEFIYGSTGSDLMAPKEARHTLDRICDRNHDGTFREYCVALRTALEAYLDRLTKLQRRRRRARGNR